MIDGYLALQPQTIPDSSEKLLQKPDKKTYRTLNRAEKVVKMPNKYAIITNGKYKDAISLLDNDTAYIQAIKEDLKMEITNGVITINGFPASCAEVMQLGKNECIEEFDIPLLRVLYSIIWGNSEKLLKQGKTPPPIVTIYVPSLLKFLEKEKGSRNEIISIITSIFRFHSLVGIINGDILPVMVYMGQRHEKNTLSFSSPYLMRVIEENFKDSIKRDKKGNPITDTNGFPITEAFHSYLIKPSIRNERNKIAVEIVHRVVTLIERAGKHKPNIKASTIVDETPLLMRALDGKTTSRKNQILRRAFKKAWELLITHTGLEKTYKGIKLPDATDPASIPTMSTLDMVFEFPHSGKDKTAT